MEEIISSAVEAKWQARWKEQGAFVPAGPGSGRRGKFFMIFAYPGISGYLHVGHMRGFTYTDVMTRYKRALGYDVLFPVGFHATGIPAISLSKRIERKDQKTIDYMLRNGAPPDVIPALADVDRLIEFFSKVYIEDYWERFGFGMDFSRCMTTVSPGYKRFITWQFEKLKEKDLLVTKPHYAPFCPNCGPVAVDSSMTDISQGGNAEVMEFTALKFRLKDGTVLPAATLRPETVFGVTNLWLHPEVEYVIVEVDGERWIVSPQAVEKLGYQRKGVSEVAEIGRIAGSELIGKDCTTPVGVSVPILPGTFVDPGVATGVVMSVPAHAPFDWIALRDVKDDLGKGKNPFGLDPSRVLSLEPITLIRTGSGTEEDPAGKLCRDMGVKSQNDKALLEEATSRIYKAEFHSGMLLPLCREYSGMRVSQVKDTLKVDFIDQGLASVFMEFSEPVICRCLTPVVISRVPEQWFIRYSDPGLTERAQEHARTMSVVPEDYKRDLPSVLEWFGDRACIRQGSWLGTEFPFKPGWIIEPISDSTLYPAYYIISPHVNDGSLPVEWMDSSFFDHVLLGLGPIEGFPPERRELISRIREEFLYWYPLDVNLGGKEHKTVHFPVFLMNHVALLEPRHWPGGIYVHWWVTMAGGDKISKTKGGAEPIPDAIRKYGVDAMRLYYCHVGSADMDVEWVEETVSHYRSRIRRLHEFFQEMAAYDGGASPMDDWLRAIMRHRTSQVMASMDSGELRDASNIVYFTMINDLKWYLRRGGRCGEAIREALGIWCRTLQPFTPHIAEELWEMIGGQGLVSLAAWPEEGPREEDQVFLTTEEYVSSLLEDITNIRKMVTTKGERVCLYTAADWRWDALRTLLDMASSGDGRLNPGDAIKTLMADPRIRPFGKEVPKLVQRLSKDVVRMGEDQLRRYRLLRNERTLLADLASFLQNELGCRVDVFPEDGVGIFDPMGRAKGSLPLKPAIYME